MPGPKSTMHQSLHIDSEGFRQIFETAPDALVLVDADGQIVLVNQQTERLFGYAPGDLLGQPVEVLIPVRYHARHVGQRRGFTEAPRARPMASGLELSARRKDG